MDTTDTPITKVPHVNDFPRSYGSGAHGVLAVQIDTVEWLQTILKESGSGCQGGAWQCPGHRDSSPSLAVDRGRDGHPVLFCRSAGCEAADILRKFGLSLRHLYHPPELTPAEWLRFAAIHIDYPPLICRPSKRRDPSFRLVAIHEYGPDFTLERWRNSAGKKDPMWFSRNPKGEMVPGLLGRHQTDLPLYRESDIGICQATGDPVYLVESESSVDALNRAGIYATTWAGGCTNPPLPQLARQLAGCVVLVVADHDEPGIRCAHRILAVLPTATGWLPPTPGTDIRDVLATDRSLSSLLPLAQQ